MNCMNCKYHGQYRRGCSVIPGGVYPADAKCQPEDRYAKWTWADDVIFGSHQQRYREVND